MKRILTISAALLAGIIALAQAPADRREVRGGNRDFRKKNYKEAEIDYRKALIKDSTSVAANYNLANTLYRMEEYSDAAKFAETAENAAQDADILFNKGDIALKNQDYNTAVDAFKRSLLLNPDDVEAKENYIYARKMLENQQQNQQNDQNQDNQNQQDNQDQNQDQNKDQDKDQDKNNQDQNKDNRNQDQNQDQNKDNQDRQQDGQQPQLTPQAAEQMLQAIQAKEKETQDKVKKEEALRALSRQKDQNW